MADVHKPTGVRETLTLTIEGETEDGGRVSLRHTDIETLSRLANLLRDMVGENAGVCLENGSMKVTIDAPAPTIQGLVRDCERYERGITEGIEPKRLTAFRKMARRAKSGDKRYTLGYRERELLQFSGSNDVKDARHRTEDVELELEGEVTCAGGKGSPCIRLQSAHGSYTISVPREVLASLSNNILYQNICVLVKCKYDVVTKEFRDYELVEITEMAEYDEDVMTEVVRHATADWKGVKDPRKWVAELRGDKNEGAL